MVAVLVIATKSGARWSGLPIAHGSYQAYHVWYALYAEGFWEAMSDDANRFLSECRAICPPQACGLEDIPKNRRKISLRRGLCA
jgi:hypothetical protein